MSDAEKVAEIKEIVLQEYNGLITKNEAYCKIVEIIGGISLEESNA